MFNIKKIKRDIALIKERKNMSDLRIKPNIANGDLPEQMELFDGEDNEMNWLKQSCNPSLMDIFNPLKMKEALDKANGHTNKDQDKQ